jgi:hypothetical protein
VQDHFLQGIQTTLDLDNVRSISDTQSRSDDAGRVLHQSFGDGLILTFDPHFWGLEAEDPRDAFDRMTSRNIAEGNIKRYDVRYMVRAALIRIEESRIVNTLWKSTCMVNLPIKMDNGPLPSKLQIADYSTLNETRDVAATKCSEQLLNKFLGKPEK